MTRHRSLSLRLGLTLGVLVSLLWLAAAGAALFVIRQEMDEVFDNSLRETAQRILPLAVTGVMNRDTAGQMRVPMVDSSEEALTYLLRDADGAVLLRSHDVREGIFPPRPATGFRTVGGYRLYGVSTMHGRYTLEISEPLEQRNEALWDAGVLLLIPLAGAIPVSVLLAWLLIRRMMRPLARLNRLVEKRKATDTSPLPSLGMPSEVMPLVNAFNRLLGRVAAAIEVERSFVANSAHELRTPLAGALAQTQRLIAETRDPATAERGGEIEGALKRLIRLSEKLLQLSRAEAGQLLGDTTDLAPIVPMVVRETADVSAHDRVRVSIGDGMLVSPLDPDAFGIVLRNLIENALLHGDPDAPILIAAAAPGELCVRNGGPVVAAEALDRLTDRFERAGATASGSGLGLAIVSTILTRAGGRLSLASPIPGQTDGFEARVTLP